MPNRVHILVLTCLLFLFGCNNTEIAEEKVPDHILSEDLFSKVLADFALAESAANMNIRSVHFQKIDSVYAFDPLKENAITQAQYDTAIVFYSNHPELYKKVYEKVLVALSEMQAKRNNFITDSASK